MIFADQQFYKPNKDARILGILDSLSVDSSLSQHELGRKLNLSGAMINQYLRDLQEGGFLRFTAVNGKSYRYELTPEGEALRSSLFAEFSSETVRLYSSLKQLIRTKLLPLEEQGLRKLALFGASETCEVVLSALRDSSFEILTLLDNDVEKQGKRFHGYVISPPGVLQAMHLDAVCITSFGRQNEIREQLRTMSACRDMEIVTL